MKNTRFGRKDRRIQPKKNDPYRNKKKYPEPAICRQCGAVFINGRWSWDSVEESKEEVTCPACERINDQYPAGQISLQGPFLMDNREEILNLIHNVEKLEKQEHPMERLMEINREEEEIQITTTGVHLARRIGESLSSSYQGELDFQYGDGEQRILVSWSR